MPVNDDAAAVASEIEEHRQRLVTPGMTAGEFAALLPPHLRQPYWAVKLEELLATDVIVEKS